MKLQYLGKDDWNNPVYKDENGRLWKDVGMRSTKLDEGETIDKSALCTITNNVIDGEPNQAMSNIGKYNNVVIKLIFNKIEKPSIYEFEYRMLSRLKSDCNYYLGNGNRYAPHLWAGNVKDQIDKMKELYNIFPNDQKPEWLTWEQILQYEKEMIQQ